jgi:hypothetical protein
MKVQLFAALTRSPVVLLGAAVCVLVALWLVISNSYALSIRSGATGVELKPAATPPVR